MQYAINDYNEGFYNTPDNFKTVRVPALGYLKTLMRWVEVNMEEGLR